jgi:tetratricopeptide (TPR) repeat protein
MQQLFARYRQELSDFIEQRDDLLFISVCSVNDAAFALQTLRDIEQASSSDLFLLFANEFKSPGEFVTAALEHLREERRLACEALAEEGREPLPPFPEALMNDEAPPADRLRGAIEYARSLAPPEGGHRLVWAMVPLKIDDRQAYLQLVSSLVPWRGVKPWMAGVRLIFRADPNFAQVAPELAEAPRARLRRTDFGAGAITREMEKEAYDEDLPMEQRMQALLSLAYTDYAENRAEDAEEKFNTLLSYGQETKNLQLQAVAINGLGDVARRRGDLDQAQHWYECALIPVAEAKQPHILATVVKNLADMAYGRERYADAEQYFDGLDKLSAHLLDPEGKATALEWRGLSQERQGKHEQAIESWETAATLCRNIGLPEQLRMNLRRLAPVYQRLRMREKLAALQTELRELETQEAR